MLNHELWLLPLGLFIGAFGTLVGAGGGFILVPILLLVYPTEDPELITGTSLAVVFFNALSGSWAYSRMKRIDYKSGSIFAAATIPGAILGAVTTTYIPRHAFDIIFGITMIAAGIYLWVSARDDYLHTPMANPPTLWKEMRWLNYLFAILLTPKEFTINTATIRRSASCSACLSVISPAFWALVGALSTSRR